MPIEVRDKYSGAKLFIPTPHEKASREKGKQLDRNIKEVEELKAELQALLKEYKK